MSLHKLISLKLEITQILTHFHSTHAIHKKLQSFYFFKKCIQIHQSTTIHNIFSHNIIKFHLLQKLSSLHSINITIITSLSLLSSSNQNTISKQYTLLFNNYQIFHFFQIINHYLQIITHILISQIQNHTNATHIHHKSLSQMPHITNSKSHKNCHKFKITNFYLTKSSQIHKSFPNLSHKFLHHKRLISQIRLKFTSQFQNHNFEITISHKSFPSQILTHIHHTNLSSQIQHKFKISLLLWNPGHKFISHNFPNFNISIIFFLKIMLCSSSPFSITYASRINK